MKLVASFSLGLSLVVVAATASAQPPTAQPKPEDLPPPPVVDPGPAGGAPSDAVVLFGGKVRDLAEWTGPGGGPDGWTVRKGEVVCTARHAKQEKTGTWDLLSKRSFGDAQIHAEVFIPLMKDAKGQARANSGLYVQGRYEVQILDSYENPTYPMGTAGAVYGHSAPSVNAARKPPAWQTYDLVFHAPACNADGTVKSPGSLTLLFNGVLVQDHVPINPKKGCDASPGPLRFQDHYHPDVVETPVRLRNVWVRPLGGS